MIANDIIYIISEYNCDLKDSVNLSLINKEIYENRNRIHLNNPLITINNHNKILKYYITGYRKEQDTIIKNINYIYSRTNRYWVEDTECLKMMPKNTKELIINLHEYIGLINLKKYQINSIIIKSIGNNKMICPSTLTHLTLENNFRGTITLTSG